MGGKKHFRPTGWGKGWRSQLPLYTTCTRPTSQPRTTPPTTYDTIAWKKQTTKLI